MRRRTVQEEALALVGLQLAFPGKQIVYVAGSESQAEKVYDQARKIVEGKHCWTFDYWTEHEIRKEEANGKVVQVKFRQSSGLIEWGECPQLPSQLVVLAIRWRRKENHER